MTFEQFWTIQIKQWKLVMICFILVGLGALIGSKLMKPLYQSSALVQVALRTTNNQADYNSLMASDQLVQTESTLATSDSVLREVTSRYPDLTETELQAEVSSNPKTNTQLFEIDVVDPSPTRAARLANDVAATLIKQQSVMIQQQNSSAQQQITQDRDRTSQEINDITTKIAALQAKSGNQNQIALLQAQLSGKQQHYSQVQTALAQLELTQAQNGDFLLITQPAYPVTKPVRPNTLLNTGAGLLAGLLLGILLALLYERLDTRVRTSEELTKLLEWSVLATIRRAKSSNREDVINPTGQDPNVEPYRILRTNIGFSAIDKPLHSMLVTSAVPRDGKSIMAANLAIFMAKAGKNTLLIDADLRRPTQHILFNLPAGSIGLTNAVMTLGTQVNTNSSSDQQFFSTLSYSSYIAPFIHSVGIPNLWIMPSGPMPPNPSELLDSKAMQRILAIIENCGVEVVIFDSPPLLGLSDASILAPKVDGVLVVIDISRATKGKLKQLKAVLLQTGANVLGCVINKQRKGRNDTTYDYYYYFSEQQDEERKSAKNGHTPTIPVSPSSSSQFDKGMRSN
jgi:Mrp family chromosome partitioning ATPase/capsular polysaccharide biosynthesis protein